ncbi:K(+)-transporting ATPase subunit F [Pelomonas sp. P7]|uniref:K(+)-transporting ATPase subunit F n=1 Tax=Pelomonas caseinilytica TaxID=2906763 RepID=A0ABS8XA04_9BURK|nr:K(+)-transporting ATPase subunit F [Pelomonas sp. P7]MCE4535752.1 K(+)-transporting ATPase subunit F [Pelomonas sp. P7]
MSAFDWVSAGLVGVLVAYLFWALLFPEDLT